MKNYLIRISLIMGLFVYGQAMGDLREDMNNTRLTLVDVVAQELKKDKSISAVVEEMISIQPDQSTAIVAAALQLRPDDLDKVLSTAIESGVRSWETVGAAILALNARSKLRSVKYIVESGIGLDPENSRRIIETAARVSDFDFNTIAGIEEKDKRDSRPPRSAYMGTVAAGEMEQVPGPHAASVVQPRSTMDKNYRGRLRISSLRTPR